MQKSRYGIIHIRQITYLIIFLKESDNFLISFQYAKAIDVMISNISSIDIQSTKTE